MNIHLLMLKKDNLYERFAPTVFFLALSNILNFATTKLEEENSDLKSDEIDNTHIYKFMYPTLFGKLLR